MIFSSDDYPAPEARKSLAHPEASEREAGRVGLEENQAEPHRGDTEPWNLMND